MPLSRSSSRKNTIAAGSSESWDPTSFSWQFGAGATINGTLALFHKQAVTTGDVKIGSNIINDPTVAIPFTNSTLILPGWSLDFRIYNTDAAAQTYVAVFSPNEHSLLDHSINAVSWDMSSTDLLVRQNDTLIFRQIMLFFSNTSTPTMLPDRIMLHVMSGNEAQQQYPAVAIRPLVGLRQYCNFNFGGLNGQNPLYTFALEQPLFIRGSDSNVTKLQAGKAWFPFLYAETPGLSAGSGSVGYNFWVVGELYQNANTSVGYQGG